MKWPVTPTSVSTHIVTSLRLWWCQRPPAAAAASGEGAAISGRVSRAATKTAAAAPVIAMTASRQPHNSLSTAVSGLPTTSASPVPT